jgi:hypothetical protein
MIEESIADEWSGDENIWCGKVERECEVLKWDAPFNAPCAFKIEMQIPRSSSSLRDYGRLGMTNQK